MSKTAAVAKTEAELFKMLEAKLCVGSGNGPTGVLIPQVRDAAGFNAKRTLDAVFLGFWPSRGLLLEGFEMKSSRTDWQTELKNPAKAEAFTDKLDKFWIVAGSSDVVREHELPLGWGLLVARGKGLVQVRPAAPLRDLSPVNGRRALPPDFDRGILVSLLRNASHRASVTPEQISDAEQRGFERGIDYAESGGRNFKELYETLFAKVRAFEQALGVGITGVAWPRSEPAHVGATLKAVLAGEHDLSNLQGRLQRLASDAAAIAQTAEEKLGDYGLKRSPTPQERQRAGGEF